MLQTSCHTATPESHVTITSPLRFPSDTIAASTAGKRILDFAFSSSREGRASFRIRHDASSPDNMSLSFKRGDSVSIILYNKIPYIQLSHMFALCL